MFFVTFATFTQDMKIEARLTWMGTRSPHPALSFSEGSKCYFVGLKIPFKDYFRRFGKEAIVLRPKSLKQKLIKTIKMLEGRTNNNK